MKYEKNTIETFLETYASKNTIRTYKSQLKKFFKIIRKNPNKYIPVGIRKLENGDKVDLEDSIIKDLKTCGKQIRKSPKKSQVAYLAVVKKYLNYWYIDIPQREWDNIKSANNLKRVRSESIKKTPTTQELKFILQSAGLKQKTFISMASSTGLRLHEVISIKLEDIDIKNRSAIVLSKNGYYRIVFFIHETKELIDAWLKQREKYIAMKTEKSIYAKENNNEDRLFPFSETTGRAIWNNLIEKAGKPFNKKNVINKKNTNKRGEPEGRYEYNFHCLRRFWLSQMHNTNINKKHYDAIAGHTSNLDNDYIEVRTHYEEKSVERKKSYDKYSSSLAIFSDYQKAKSEFGGKIGYQTRMLRDLSDKNQFLNDELKIIKVEKSAKDKEYYNLKKYLENTIMPKFHNMEHEINDIKNYYEEQKDREKRQDQINKEEEAMSPKEKAEQRKIDVRVQKRAIEFDNKEREKEAAKTPEQKAEEKKKIDKQWKKLKESMQ